MPATVAASPAVKNRGVTGRIISNLLVTRSDVVLAVRVSVVLPRASMRHVVS